MGRLAVDGTSDGLGGAEDLLDGAFQLPRHGAFPHDAGDVDDLFEGNVAAVLDVLDLLAVTWGLLEGADEKRRGAGNHAHRRLTILDRQFDSDAETLERGEKKVAYGKRNLIQGRKIQQMKFGLNQKGISFLSQISIRSLA